MNIRIWERVSVEWAYLAQNRSLWPDLVKTVKTNIKESIQGEGQEGDLIA
jgi:hypothetical protein